MKQVPIWKGHYKNRKFTGLYALVDDEDYERVMVHKWTLAEGYPIASIKVKGIHTKIDLHRFVMNAKPRSMYDHIDRTPLNCQKSNLRRCTKAQNGWNRPKPRNPRAMSRFKGVQWKPSNRNKPHHGSWLARIHKNNRVYQIGYFKKEEHAAMAYDLFAPLVHGKFSAPNFTPALSGP